MPLDSDTRQLLDSFSDGSAPALYELPIQEARESLKRLTATMDVPFYEVASVEYRTIPSDSGGIGIRIYKPIVCDSTPALGIFVMCHGGGYVMGDIDTHDHVSRFYCVHGGRDSGSGRLSPRP